MTWLMATRTHVAQPRQRASSRTKWDAMKEGRGSTNIVERARTSTTFITIYVVLLRSLNYSCEKKCITFLICSLDQMRTAQNHLTIDERRDHSMCRTENNYTCKVKIFKSSCSNIQLVSTFKQVENNSCYFRKTKLTKRTKKKKMQTPTTL